MTKAAGYTHPAYPFFACATILIPAHPSFQFIWLSYGVPPYLVAIILSVPVFYYLLTRHRVARAHAGIILLFTAYIFWMLVRSIGSPALGEENYISSLRSLLVLTPLSLICALVASKDIKIASVAISTSGLIAVLHLLIKLFTGDISSDVPGFVSLSSDDQRQNYQSTSYYLGFVGLAIASFWLRYRRMALASGLFGFGVIIILMLVVGARSSIVALLVGLLVIMSFVPVNKLIVRAIYVLLLCVLISYFVSLFGLVDNELIAQRVVAIDRFAILLEGDDSSHRLYLFSSAISLWLDSAMNFVIGAGLGAFPIYIGAAESGWYPHNFILESLAEGGVVAGFLLFGIGLQMLVRLFRLRSFELSEGYLYSAALAFYAVAAYQFMGGIQTLWIPLFFVALFIFGSFERRC